MRIDFNAGWSTIGRYRTSKKSNKTSSITNASSVGKSTLGNKRRIGQDIQALRMFGVAFYAEGITKPGFTNSPVITYIVLKEEEC